MPAVVVLLTLTLASAALLPPAHAAGGIEYQPPVDGPVVDPFRAPTERWGPGNRGVDYAVPAGTPVRAAAAGTVAFAGQVGGDLHVVVLHGDGLRTSYSFLATVSVGRGDAVEQAEVVGTADDTVHFGIRDGDRYLNPLEVLDGRVRVQLLPDRDVNLDPEPAERAAIVRLAGDLPKRVKAGAAWLTDHAPEAWRGWVHYATEVATPTTLRVAAAVAEWRRQRDRCTPPDSPPPPATERRRAVLVAGLGSTSAAAAVHAVDTHGLGYAPDDVTIFSYRGGTTRDKAYESADTKVDLRLSGDRLRALVAALATGDGSPPVDVIGHSQGGVVARIALLEGAPATLLATLGSPHSGADLATAAAMVTAAGIPVAATSVLQMAETSPLMRELRRRPLPSGARVVSVAARGDVVVPPPRSWLDGADNVTVTLGPPLTTVHHRLPGSPQATRELALALAGLPPTCQTLLDVASDHLVGAATSLAEDTLGAALALAANNLRQ